MDPDEILLASQEYLFPAVFHYYREPLVVARAKNQFVYDSAGRAYTCSKHDSRNAPSVRPAAPTGRSRNAGR